MLPQPSACGRGRGASPLQPPLQPGEPDSISFAEAKRRKELALAQLRELEVAEKEGEVLPLSEHEQRLQSICERLAARVKGLGRYMGDVQRATTDFEAAELLERISDDLLRSLMSVADEIEDEDSTPNNEE